MKFIKKFNLHQDYLNYINNSPILPNLSYCLDAKDLHLNEDIFNGYEYVDLGLPSGTLWATKNIGASSITDNGLYFSWGSTTGYTAEQVGVNKNFSWADYELGDGGSSDANMLKYNSTDGLKTLEPIDDAATVLMGGEWHIPSSTQVDELLNNTYVTNANVTDYQGTGVNGRLFTSVADNTKTLFFPYANYYENGSISSFTNYTLLWANNYYVNNRVYYYAFGSSNVTSYNSDRYYGYSIRGVVG